jgi:hypothetical protein
MSEFKGGRPLDHLSGFVANGYYSEWTGLRALPGFHLVEYEDGWFCIEKDEDE